MEIAAVWYEVDNWRGYLLVDPASVLLRRHVGTSFVAGLRFHAATKGDPSFAPGRRLVVRPEPDNPQDPGAIALWNADASLQIGYLPRETSSKMTIAERVGLVLHERLADGERIQVGVLLSHETVDLVTVERDLEWGRRRVAQLKAQVARGLAPPPTADPIEQMRRMAEDLRREQSPG